MRSTCKASRTIRSASPADYEISDFEPDRRIGFRAIADPVRPEGSYELEPIGGETPLTFTLSCSPGGLATLMTPMVAKTMRRGVTQLDRLRAILET